MLSHIPFSLFISDRFESTINWVHGCQIFLDLGMLLEAVSFGKQLFLCWVPYYPHGAPFEENWLLDPAILKQERATKPTRAGCRSTSSPRDSPQRTPVTNKTGPFLLESLNVSLKRATHAEEDGGGGRREPAEYREGSEQKPQGRAEQLCCLAVEPRNQPVGDAAGIRAA